MKSLLTLLSGLLIATTVAAQDGDSKDGANPFLDTPAPELRQRLADLAPVFQEQWYQVEVVVDRGHLHRHRRPPAARGSR